jgi:hypothetical protein
MGDRGRSHPIGNAELAENVGDVQCGGLRADQKRLGDLTVGQTPRRQGQNLLLTGCETELGEPRCITQRSKINNGRECDDGHSGRKVASAYVAGSKWNWSPSGLLAMDAVSQGASSLQAFMDTDCPWHSPPDSVVFTRSNRGGHCRTRANNRIDNTAAFRPPGNRS